MRRIVDEVAAPVAREMVNRGTPYQGLLYVGAAWGPEGPAVVEFNARFGDPETQPVLSMLETPLDQVLLAVANGTLAELPPLTWADGYAATVVLAAENYPASPAKGDAITGAELDNPEKVLHAGTARTDEGYVSAGGRVLNVLGHGATLEDAIADAYRVIEGIEMRGSFYRKDIGRRAVAGEVSVEKH